MPQDAVVQLAKHSAYDGDAVQQLRALSSEALEELSRDLWEAALSGSGSGGAWAVQAAWLGSPGRLSELATSGSHAVGVRALTALLKTDPARLLSLLGFCGDGGVVETSPLSAARRRVALRTLGRLSRTTLEGLVTPELLNKLVSVPSDCPSAARLLKGANPEIVEVWWPKLPVPCSTAISIATRLPQLTLQLIVDAPQRWKEHEFHKARGSSKEPQQESLTCGKLKTLSKELAVLINDIVAVNVQAGGSSRDWQLTQSPPPHIVMIQFRIGTGEAGLYEYYTWSHQASMPMNQGSNLPALTSA